MRSRLRAQTRTQNGLRRHKSLGANEIIFLFFFISPIFTFTFARANVNTARSSHNQKPADERSESAGNQFGQKIFQQIRSAHLLALVVPMPVNCVLARSHSRLAVGWDEAAHSVPMGSEVPPFFLRLNGYVQFSTVSPSTRLNSRWLLVTSVQPTEKAWADHSGFFCSTGPLWSRPSAMKSSVT